MIKLRTSYHCRWHGCRFVLSSPHFNAQINRLTLSHVLKSAWALVRSALSQYSATHPPPSSSLRKCWRSYLWGETWDQVMWRSQTVRRNGPSVGWLMRFVFSTLPLCIAARHSRNTATYVTAKEKNLSFFFKLKLKSHQSSRPLWNAAPSAHFWQAHVKTVQFQINSLKHAAFDLVLHSMCTRDYKESQFPVHVNETQTCLCSSKALLSADCPHSPLAKWQATAG